MNSFIKLVLFPNYKIYSFLSNFKMVGIIQNWREEIEKERSRLEWQLEDKKALLETFNRLRKNNGFRVEENNGFIRDIGTLKSVLNYLDEEPLKAYILFSILGDLPEKSVGDISRELRERFIDLYLFVETNKNLIVPNIAGVYSPKDKIFAYDLQAPGKVESWYSIMELGNFMAISNILGVDANVGISDPQLSRLNKELQNVSEQEIQEMIERRKSIFEKFGVRFSEYKKPHSIEAIVESVWKDNEIKALFEGNIAQVLVFLQIQFLQNFCIIFLKQLVTKNDTIKIGL